MTYDEALRWNRLERIFALIASLLLVIIVEFMSSSQPTWLITSLAAIIIQLAVLKCWLDMGLMSRPYKNCWEFKD